MPSVRHSIRFSRCRRARAQRSLLRDSLSFLAKQLGYITRLGHLSQELFWKKLKKVFECSFAQARHLYLP